MVSDLGLSCKFVLGLVFYPITPDRPELCYLSAMSGSFFANATVMWYLMISFNILATFKGVNGPTLRHYRWIQHVLVWSSSVLVSLVPYFLDAYGAMTDDLQCWISKSDSPARLVYIIPLSVAVTFSVGVFVTTYRGVKALFPVGNQHYNQLIIRLAVFNGVFCCTWIWPLVAAIWTFADVDSRPEWLNVMDLVVICCNGCFNSLVWVFFKKFESTAFVPSITNSGANNTYETRPYMHMPTVMDLG